MDVSLTEYLKSVLKRWWWLVVGLIGGLLGLAPLVGINLEIPSSVGWLIFFIGLFVAQFLAYHDLRVEKIKLEDDLKEAKMYEAKSQRIEIISKEKYPAEILRIFDDMRRCLSEIVEFSDNMTDVNPEKLIDPCRGITPHELYLALNQQTLEDNVSSTYTFYRNFNLGIGLINLQEKNDKWRQLIEDYETVKKDIPDQKLIMSMGTHFEAINGVNAIRLYYRYMKKYGATEMNIRAVEPFRPVSDLQDQTMSRVNKRILELKLGEEPQWEMLYFKGKK